MKAKILPFMATLLLLGGGFAACDSNDDPLAEMFPDGIKPVIPDGKLGKELTDFFNENLKWITASLFKKPIDPHAYETWFMADTCVMINSVEEFQAIDFIDGTPPLELPAIDFNAYTLVAGKYTDGSGSIMASQNLVVTLNKATLNLLVKEPADNIDVILTYSFWVLYPKFASETIDLNVVHKYL